MDSTPAMSNRAFASVQANPVTIPSGSNAMLVPVLRSDPQRPENLMLPVDVLEQIFKFLSVRECGSLFQVCTSWNLAGARLRQAASHLSQMRSFDTGNLFKSLQPAQFEEHLGAVFALPPADMLDGLIMLSRLLKSLSPGMVPGVLSLLQKKLESTPLEVQRRVWCSVARSLSGKGRRQEIDFIIAATSRLPLLSQALVLAGLCHDMPETDGRLDIIIAASSRFDLGEMESEGDAGLATTMNALACAEEAANVKRLKFCLFGYYRMPFLSFGTPARKDVAYIADIASGILQMNLSHSEKLELLLHRNHQGLPWLAQELRNPASSSLCGAYMKAVSHCPLASEDLILLLSGYDEDGMPAFGKMIRDIADSRFLDVEYEKGNFSARGNCLACSQEYIDQISSNSALPSGVKVTLLRAQMKGSDVAREVVRSRAVESIGTELEAILKLVMKGRHEDNRHLDNRVPNGDAPFFGLSMIDSLFHDSLQETMMAYMDSISNSKLSNEEKFGVLRLAHADRLDIGGMYGAYGTYCSGIRRSGLPGTMQTALQQELNVKFELPCSIL
ncbi:F-box protein [Noviherbaspirillum soli]|uniref:F-box protein n=1 Tax=Noviherbaspirillum soli TaxID=1064518 RepID=UPI00188BF94B|nr:F-box protein [Noviherbaspirillum soli]